LNIATMNSASSARRRVLVSLSIAGLAGGATRTPIVSLAVSLIASLRCVPR
jgi:hypothetical protein